MVGIRWVMPAVPASLSEKPGRASEQGQHGVAHPALSRGPSQAPSALRDHLQHRKSERGANPLLCEAGDPFLDVMQLLQGEEGGVIGNK